MNNLSQVKGFLSEYCRHVVCSVQEKQHLASYYDEHKL